MRHSRAKIRESFPEAAVSIKEQYSRAARVNSRDSTGTWYRAKNDGEARREEGWYAREDSNL